jgi:putative membrane protein
MARLFLHTLHIIVVIIWMGVLLLMPILFIYQMNAAEISAAEGKPAIEQCKKISRHLWIGFGWPVAILTIIIGLALMHPFLQSSWFWVKMAFVAALLGFHHIIHFAFKALQKDRYEKSVAQFHSLGYAGIIFMVSIVALAVLKNTINQFFSVGVLLVGLVLILLTVRFMNTKKIRIKR